MIVESLWWDLCSPVSEASYCSLDLFKLLFGFDTSVENWTVPALAQNVLMKRSLATLALNPKVAVLLLVVFELLLSLNVDVLDPRRAIVTDDVLFWFEKIFAPKASLLDFGKLEKPLR